MRLLLIYSTTALLAILILIVPSAGFSQPAVTDVRSFLQAIVGDWIGTMQQSTDGKAAAVKYFHATVRPSGANSYQIKFDDYRVDQSTHGLLAMGTSTYDIAINADGSARSTMVGEGTVLVDFQPKDETHRISEILTYAGDGLRGLGSGTIDVSGLPFNLGKNGKITNAVSTWTLSEDGVLTMTDTLKAQFRVIFVNRSYQIAAVSTAKRGTDVNALVAAD